MYFNFLLVSAFRKSRVSNNYKFRYVSGPLSFQKWKINPVRIKPLLSRCDISIIIQSGEAMHLKCPVLLDVDHCYFRCRNMGRQLRRLSGEWLENLIQPWDSSIDIVANTTLLFTRCFISHVWFFINYSVPNLDSWINEGVVINSSICFFSESFNKDPMKNIK